MSRVVAGGAAVVFRGLLFGGVLALVLIAAGTRIGPMVGQEVFVISGASMRPTIELGSAIVASSAGYRHRRGVGPSAGGTSCAITASCVSTWRAANLT